MQLKYYKIVIYIFLLLISYPLHSQKVLWIEAQVSPGLSNIHSTIPQVLSEKKAEGNIAINFGIIGTYFPTKKLGYSIGLQFMNFSETNSGNNYYSAFNTVDSENEAYERRIWGNNISEKVDLGVLHIPIKVSYVFWENRSLKLYGAMGPGISIPIVKNLTGKGTFTYKGYYPQEKALLYDLPEFGFSSDVNVNSKGKLKTNLAFVDFGITVGAAFNLNRYYKLHTMIGYNLSLTNPVKAEGSHSISNNINSYHGFMNIGKNRLTNAYLSIGISKSILF